MRPAWREFLQTLPAQLHFLHRDELRHQFPELVAQPLPAVFRRNRPQEPWQVFLSAQELKPLDLPGLMQAVKARL